MTLFEDICLDLLLEGKTPEEILAMLKYKFKDIPEDIIDKIFTIDETKKKSYTQWVLSHWKNESELIKQLLDNGKMKAMFDYIKEKHDVQIQQYKTVQEMFDDLKLKLPADAEGIDLLKKDGDGPENDFDILYNDENWAIVTPNTYPASHKLGVGTAWCTAGWKWDRGEYYYNNYLQRGGKYYINFDKRESETDRDGNERPYKRYQFHFESNQFMDIEDDPVDINDLDMPEGVVQFYEDAGYDVNDIENDEERYERYSNARYDDGTRLFGDYWLLCDFDDDYDVDTIGDGGYRIYDVSNDDRDSEFPRLYFNDNPLYIGDRIIILNQNYRSHNDTNVSRFISERGETASPCIFNYEEGSGRYGSGSIGLIGGEDEDIEYYDVMDEWNIVWAGDYNIHFGDLDYIEYPNGCDRLVNCISIDYLDDKYYYECIWDNGEHSLIVFDSYNESAKYVITLDQPKDGERFTIEEDEDGDYFVEGRRSTYYLDEDNYEQKGKQNIQIIRKVQFNAGDYYIVRLSDSSVNVYDAEERRLIFKENFYNIYDLKDFTEDTGVVYCANWEENTKLYLYSITTGKEIWDKPIWKAEPINGGLLIQTSVDNNLVLMDKTLYRYEAKYINPTESWDHATFICRNKKGGWTLYSKRYGPVVDGIIGASTYLDKSASCAVYKLANGKFNIYKDAINGKIFDVDVDKMATFQKRYSVYIFSLIGEEYYLYWWQGCETYKLGKYDEAIEALKKITLESEREEFINKFNEFAGKPKQATAVTENFNRFLKRINDVEF